MKRKPIFLVVLISLLLLCTVAFRKPLSLSDLVKQDNTIAIEWNTLAVTAGEPSINSAAAQSVTSEQKTAILNVLKEYPYQRTLRTLYADGSLSETGDTVLSIYVYDGTAPIDSIIIASSGQLAVNDKRYHMKNAEQLIAQIIAIAEPAN